MTLLMNQVTLNHMAVLPMAMRLLKPPAPSRTAIRAHLGLTLSSITPAANFPICMQDSNVPDPGQCLQVRCCPWHLEVDLIYDPTCCKLPHLHVNTFQSRLYRAHDGVLPFLLCATDHALSCAQQQEVARGTLQGQQITPCCFRGFHSYA